jgi:8-hydroxy-5-deazaflavin:NADPH oxidoreductase
MSASTRIAVIGAGNVGGGLGARLSNAGFPVRFGVRPGGDVAPLLARCAKDASSSEPAAAAAWGEVVFLAVPGSAAVDVARSLAPELAGKVVVDCNNPLTWSAGPVWAPPPEGSLAAAVAAAAPGARVVKGFNTFGAEHHADPGLTGAPAQVFLAGDDDAAKQLVSAVAAASGFAPVDAGPLRNAPVLENVAMLWIHLATVGGHGRAFTFRMQARA